MKVWELIEELRGADEKLDVVVVVVVCLENGTELSVDYCVNDSLTPECKYTDGTSKIARKEFVLYTKE